MKALFAFGLLILIAFLGSRFLTRRKNFSPFFFIFHTGLIYLLLGIALGNKGLNILSPEVLEHLSPLLILGLGWVGFVFGFQFEKKYLQRFQRKFISFSFFYFLIFLLTISGLAYLLMSRVIELNLPEALSFSFALALLFSLTSPTVLDVILFQVNKKELPSYLARFIVSVTSFWGILGLAFLVFFMPHQESSQPCFWWPLCIFTLSISLPILIAFLFHRLTRKKVSEEEMLLFLLGLVFLCAGIADSLGLAPLFPTMILGIAYSNMTRRQEKLYPLLLNTEKPMFVVLFILVGALWQPQFSWPLAWVILLLIVLKILVLIGLISPLTSLLHFPFPFSPWYGLCFLSSGVMGVTFTVCVYLWWGLTLSQLFMTVGLISVICLDFLSPWVLRLAVVCNKKVYACLDEENQ